MASRPAGGALLPAGWTAAQDASGRTYYLDSNTQTTHWSPPGVGVGSRGAPADRWIEAAHGELRVPVQNGTAWQRASTIEIQGATGALICIIHIGATKDQPVTIALPDGSVAATLRPVSRFIASPPLRGSAGESFGEADICMESALSCNACMGKTHAGFDVRVDGKRVLRATAPSRPWVCPFVTVTCCLGAACVNCMLCGPTYHLIKEGQTEPCGDIAMPMGCKRHVENDTRYSCIVRTSDLAVLRASVNVLAYNFYAATYFLSNV